MHSMFTLHYISSKDAVCYKSDSMVNLKMNVMLLRRKIVILYVKNVAFIMQFQEGDDIIFLSISILLYCVIQI